MSGLAVLRNGAKTRPEEEDGLGGVEGQPEAGERSRR